MSDWFLQHERVATVVLIVAALLGLSAIGLAAAGDWGWAALAAILALTLFGPLRALVTGEVAGPYRRR